MSTAVVIGGGISGLSACYYLQKTSKFAKIIVVEGSGRVGGWLHTVKQEDGSLFELGPRSIRPVESAGLNTLQLVEDLGMSKEILGIKRSHPATKNRFIYANSKLNAIPNKPGAMFKSSPLFGAPLVSCLVKDFFQSKSGLEDESIYNFVKRRFGYEVAEYAVDPLCRGIFAGDCRHLSVRSCMPQLYEYEKNYGSVVMGAIRTKKSKGKEPCDLAKKVKEESWASYSFKQGVQQLVNTLEGAVSQSPQVELVKNSTCSSVISRDGKLQVKVNGDEVSADHVISSIYAKDLADMLAPRHKPLATSLSRIPAVDTVVVNIQLDKHIDLSPPGFGHLLPSSESGKILGVIYDSCSFPQHDSKASPSTRFTVMMGGSWFKELQESVEDMSEQGLAELAVDSLRKQLGLSAGLGAVRVSVLKNCIPQYRVGHYKILEDIFGYIKEHRLPLSLVGSSYLGPSINHCINNSRLEMERITGVQL